MRIPVCLSVCLICLADISPTGVLGAEGEPVKVYILAGQSNMDGYGGLEALEYQARHGDEDRQEFFAHLFEKGEFVVRDDVWITFQDRKGPLTAGFGVHKNMMGVEWNFGNVVGDHQDAKVLLIKTSWGGASIRRKFRPPSSGKPTKLIEEEHARNLARYEKELEKQKDTKNKPRKPEIADVESQYGENYAKMIKVVRAALADIKSIIPSYAGEGYEIAGFVWFQGWNDQYADAQKEYATHLESLIRDVRKEFGKPRLPVVVGQMGHGGTNKDRAKRGLKPIGDITQAIKQAQADVCSIDEFRGTAAVVETDVFWDWKAQAVYDKGWREHLEEWRKIGAHFPFHYLGSPYFFTATGRAFGGAMVGLHTKR